MSTRGSNAIPSCSITSRRRMVLYLKSSTGAGGRVETGGASALGHTSIRHYRCGRARGKTACGWGKTTSKLAAIECRLGATLLAPVASVTASTAVKVPKSSPPHIALVKADCVNLSNNLVHVLMHEILLQSEVWECCSVGWIELASIHAVNWLL
jgi:hypothetical protein